MFDLKPVQILASIPAIMIVFFYFGYAEAKVATWFVIQRRVWRDASHCHQWRTLI